MSRFFDYQQFFSKQLQDLKSESRYRTFLPLGRACEDLPYAWAIVNGVQKKIVSWCSNDYLGMSAHPSVIQAATRTMQTRGVGAGGTRNIAGTHYEILELENALAEIQSKEAALVFSSGYAANEAALAALGRVLPSCVFISDEENHASIIRGMAASKAERIVFRHNDVSHLKEILSSIPTERPKIVVFESVYSMSGDFAKLVDIIIAAKEAGALVYVDETHGVGIYGDNGAGVCYEFGVNEHVDIIQGGLGKGYGVIGGFISGSKEIVDIVRSFGSAFIFTTALPPMICSAATASVNHLASSSIERMKHRENVRKAKTIFKLKGIPMLDSPSHIIPVMIKDSKLCKEISDRLLTEFNIYIQPINYPTVPKGHERLRITPTPMHSDELILDLAEALEQILKEEQLLKIPEMLVA